MEQDIVYKICKIIEYPWASRIDRTVYKKYPELDPVKVGQMCMVAGIVGYWIGKIRRRSRVGLAMGCMAPFVGKFLVDEWRIAKEVQKDGRIDFKKYPKI